MQIGLTKQKNIIRRSKVSEEKLELNKLCIILEVQTNTPIEDEVDARIIAQDILKTVDPEMLKSVRWMSCFGYGGKKDVFGDDIIKEKEEIFNERFGDKVLIFRNCKPGHDTMFLGEIKDGDKGYREES